MSGEGRGGGDGGDRAPEDVRSQPGAADGGPVPVRDLMKRMTPAPESEGEARWEGVEREFELEGVEWLARAAGVGMYGTGDQGTARLLAVHFHRADAPDRPVREALVASGRFPELRAEELRVLFARATPIELDEQQS